jgi:hypothetical protein
LQAVTGYLSDAKAHELREATPYKLKGIFPKRYLPWTESKLHLFEGNRPSTRPEFRATWEDAALAKKKKPGASSGSFGFARGPAGSPPILLRLGIAIDQAPTDCFTREEFDKIMDATYLYRENRWE